MVNFYNIHIEDKYIVAKAVDMTYNVQAMIKVSKYDEEECYIFPEGLEYTDIQKAVWNLQLDYLDTGKLPKDGKTSVAWG